MISLRVQMGELDRLLKGHQQDEQENLAVGRTGKMATRLVNSSEVVERLADAVAELQRAGIAVVLEESLETLAEAAAQAREATREDGLAAGRADEPPIVASMAGLVDRLKAQIGPAWLDLKEQQVPPVIDEELLAFAALEDPSVTARYENVMTKLFTLGERAEPKEGDVSRWIVSVAELRVISAEVAKMAPSDGVREFLSAAGKREGASLDLLDNVDVSEWLSDPERRKRYRIVARTG